MYVVMRSILSCFTFGILNECPVRRVLIQQVQGYNLGKFALVGNCRCVMWKRDF